MPVVPVSRLEFMANTFYYLEFTDSKMDFHLTIPDHAACPNDRPKSAVPDWARLSCHQCSHCKLTGVSAEYCPPACDMIDLVEHFSNSHSYDTVHLHMWKNGEMHTIRTDLQRALSYLYPAILASSACPYAVLLSPMKKFGKPFPDLEDFLFYALSFGLIRNYLHDDQNRKTEDMLPASDQAHTVALIFHGLLLRIRQSSMSDASVNALIKNIQWSWVTLHPKIFLRNHLEKYFAWQLKGSTEERRGCP